MKAIKKFMTLAAALTAAAVIPFSAWAATDDDYEMIESVDFEIYSSIEIGQEEGSEENLEVTLDSDGCEITSVTVTNQPKDGWEEDDHPKVRIVLEAYDDYRFVSGFSKEDVYLAGIGGDVVSATRSSKKLTVTIELPEVGEYDYYSDEDFNLDLDRESFGWDVGYRGIAYWDGNDYAKSYEVKIYRNGDEIETTKTLTTEDTDYDFSAYFRGEGDYTFRVRAVRNSANKGDWERSDEQHVSASEAAEIYGQRKNDGYAQTGGTSNSSGQGSGDTSASALQSDNGQWILDANGWWWLRSDRTWPVNQWDYINNEWYWFTEDGYCVMNSWITVNGVSYYLGESGAMYANRRTPDGYWVDENGAWDGKEAVR